MGIIRKILCATVFAAACASRLAAQSLPELPAFPVSPLGKADFEALAKSDTPEGWKAFAERSKKSAEDFFKRQLYDESASWIYTALAADMFAECGEEMPFELKSAILEDLPSFFDFYESMTPYDKPEGVCKMLASIHSLYPVQFRKFRRAAYALSLIYDDEPPIDWPECNVPSNPTRMSVPTEIFFYFTENPSTLIFPLERLTVGELVWVMGVGGPMDELKGLRNPNITPYSVEKLASSIKTDMSRVSLGRFEPWPEGVPYTPDNIKKRGGGAHRQGVLRVANRQRKRNPLRVFFLQEQDRLQRHRNRVVCIHGARGGVEVRRRQRPVGVRFRIRPPRKPADMEADPDVRPADARA